MEAARASLRRTFCVPQKCSACQEVIVSERIRCKICRRVAHPSCQRSSQGPCAHCSKLESVVVSRLMASEQEERRRISSSSSTTSSSSSIYRRIHDWISGGCDSSTGSSGLSRTGSEKHVRGLYGLNSSSGKMARKRLKMLLGRADNHSSTVRPMPNAAGYTESASGDSGIGSPASVYEKPPTTATPRAPLATRTQDRRYSDATFNLQQTTADCSCRKGFWQPLLATNGSFGARLFASSTVPSSSPRRTKTSSPEHRTLTRHDVCATWPPPGKTDYGIVDDALDDSESGFEDDDSIRSAYPTVATVNVAGEWQIPFTDVQFGQLVRHGRQCDIYRGRWHGEVMIHTFGAGNDEETCGFWAKVASLSMIRHENVSLFMGICVDLPRMAIVTSVRKGCSLHEHIRFGNHKFPLPTRVHIARQISQGMSYLHARGIVHQKLNSKNVLLENKVRVCLLDNAMAQSDHDREGYGCLPNGHLTYVSPELMRSLRVDPPQLCPQHPYTKPSDVFAFGTILYELFGDKLPFHGQCPQAIIWQVGSGHLQSVQHLKCTPSVKNLLSSCWCPDAERRPAFQDILLELQQNVMMHKRHSSSEPEKLNRLGFATTNLIAY